jgi:hypothetical protein
VASAKGHYAGQRGAFSPGDVTWLTPTRWSPGFLYEIGWRGGFRCHQLYVLEGCCIVVDRAVVQMDAAPWSDRWYMYYQIILPDSAVVWTTGVGIDLSNCITMTTYSLLPQAEWPAVFNQNMKRLSYNNESKLWI